MSRIRLIEIENFRSIKALKFCPSPGINCFIGPGDSGKSTLLDAIDLCLGARRNFSFSDTDFHGLNVDSPIKILLTLGDLEESLKNLENYGSFLRGFSLDTGEVHDEPEVGLETVITLKLEVQSDLEPAWSLYSERASVQGYSRGLPWPERVKLAPTRIGAIAHHNLGWQRGSVLNRISDERADASATLAKAAREARAAFGEKAAEQLGDALGIVSETAEQLGIPIGGNVRALLDAHSVSFVGGTISLHNASGVPLRGLGIGSTRLLIAGLQRKASDKSKVILVDELEHGLEPHRIIRLIGSLGAKEDIAPLQVFATTHSPTALRELSADQLVVVRRSITDIILLPVGNYGEAQGTIRLAPEAFLAGSVLMCEGASEVGIIRGIDQYQSTIGVPSVFASGVALVDAGGVSKIYKRTQAFSQLGYRVAVMRDDDVPVDASTEGDFEDNGGSIFKWDPGDALEQALFNNLSDEAVKKLVIKAARDHTPALIDAHIKQSSKNLFGLNSFKDDLTEDLREVLGLASKSKSSPWFKTVTQMEEIGRDIVGPDLHTCKSKFSEVVNSIFSWARHVQP